MISNAALLASLAKYDALVKDAKFTNWGYWTVTFSVAPAVDMQVMVCDNTITREQAIASATLVLTSRTGQKVRQPK